MIKFFPSLLLKDYLLGIISIRKKKVKYTRVIDSAIFFFFFLVPNFVRDNDKRKGRGRGEGGEAKWMHEIGCESVLRNVRKWVARFTGLILRLSSGRAPDFRFATYPPVLYVHSRKDNARCRDSNDYQKRGIYASGIFRVLETTRPPSPPNKIKP